MEAFIGIAGVILGALAGTVVTYATTRSTMRLELAYQYDRALRDKRLEYYQQLFHLSKSIPRRWRGEEPARQDLLGSFREFHDWYFGADAGGMFLTPDAKSLYLRLQDALAAASLLDPPDRQHAPAPDSPLSAGESAALRSLASDLRHQLAEDVDASHPPRLHWTTPALTVPAPPDNMPLLDGQRRRGRANHWWAQRHRR